jgi:hypothetical protein
MILANLDKVEDFQPVVIPLYLLLFLYYKICFMLLNTANLWVHFQILQILKFKSVICVDIW